MNNIKEHLQEMASRILTQDIRITADPIFMVQRRIRTYGIEEGYSDDYEFLMLIRDALTRVRRTRKR